MVQKTFSIFNFPLVNTNTVQAAVLCTYILEPVGHPDPRFYLAAPGDAAGGADPVPHPGLGLRVHHLRWNS